MLEFNNIDSLLDYFHVSHHDSFIASLVTIGQDAIDDHYSQYQSELAIDTDAQPYVNFNIANHRIQVQYDPHPLSDISPELIQITNFDGTPVTCSIFKTQQS